MPVLLATAYFPPIGYMAGVLQADRVRIEALETYAKQSCRNHCIIAGPNGPHTLTVPVEKPDGNRTLTRDVRVSNHTSWQRNHKRSIETAYNNSPFFLFYSDPVMPVFEKHHHFLLDLNLGILEVLLKILKASPLVDISESFDKQPVGWNDLRSISGSKKPVFKAVYPEYTQVFSPVRSFIPGLSILDLIFNIGPEAPGYLRQL